MGTAATVYLSVGRWQRVVNLMGEAMRLDPFIANQLVGNVLGAALYQLGRYSEAARAARYCVERAPTNVLCHVNLVRALGQTGAESAARAEAAVFEKLSPGYTIFRDVARPTRHLS